MADFTITESDISGRGVVGLADTPHLDTAAMQRKFDELALDVIIPKYNELTSALGGEGWAESIGSGENTLKAALDERALRCEVLTRTNTEPFTPSGDYAPATKKYVDDYAISLGAGDMLKAVYDPDGDGCVARADTAADAEMLCGLAAESFARAPLVLSATLAANGWQAAGTGGGAPYLQTIATEQLTADDRVHIAPVYSADLSTALVEREAWGAVCAAESAAGTVTFKCFESRPAVDITVMMEAIK